MLYIGEYKGGPTEALLYTTPGTKVNVQEHIMQHLCKKCQDEVINELKDIKDTDCGTEWEIVDYKNLEYEDEIGDLSDRIQELEEELDSIHNRYDHWKMIMKT